jgi:CheY-like chemotaxis protein
MHKVLLIDDEAENGWKEIIEKVLFNNESIDIALDVSEASDRLENTKYDIIFLDLRFGEQDHVEKNIERFTGYKILTENIRKSFDSLNFSTAVLLFTASNKIWNVFEILDNGADSYYIKEHPATSFDLEFSRKNFIRLKENIPCLIALSHKRDIILAKANEIIRLSKTTISNNNIQDRVEEKLKIGYATLFHGISRHEMHKLVFNNELMAFIAFWSILEEIVKDCFKDEWVKTGDQEGYMLNGNWKLKNDKDFVFDFLDNRGRPGGRLLVGLKYEEDKYIEGSVILEPKHRDYNQYRGRISLSLQVYAVMLLYKEWSADQAKRKFENINKYRNQVDFIHSSVNSIFSKRLSDPTDYENAYTYCVKILDFLIEILK